jgi:hypothetical protein
MGCGRPAFLLYIRGQFFGEDSPLSFEFTREHEVKLEQLAVARHPHPSVHYFTSDAMRIQYKAVSWSTP